jgi:hypothetical protein
MASKLCSRLLMYLFLQVTTIESKTIIMETIRNLNDILRTIDAGVSSNKNIIGNV